MEFSRSESEEPASDKPGVLLANVPRSYREALGLALQELRPGVEVLISAPEDLDAAVDRFSPAMVVCSRATPAVEAGAFAWVVLYPDHERRVITSIGGRRSEAEEIEFGELLAIVDRVLDEPGPGRNGRPGGAA